MSIKRKKSTTTKKMSNIILIGYKFEPKICRYLLIMPTPYKIKATDSKCQIKRNSDFPTP